MRPCLPPRVHSGRDDHNTPPCSPARAASTAAFNASSSFGTHRFDRATMSAIWQLARPARGRRPGPYWSQRAGTSSLARVPLPYSRSRQRRKQLDGATAMGRNLVPGEWCGSSIVQQSGHSASFCMSRSRAPTSASQLGPEIIVVTQRYRLFEALGRAGTRYGVCVRLDFREYMRPRVDEVVENHMRANNARAGSRLWKGGELRLLD